MKPTVLNSKFEEVYGSGKYPVFHFFAPGRVILMGDHLDYNGGSVLSMNIPMGITISIRQREDHVLQLKSGQEQKEISVDLTRPLAFDPLNGWGNYPIAIAKYLLLANMPIPGADILYFGNLPAQEGLASSSALEAGTGFALMHLIEQETDLVALALLCQHAHNEFFGDFSGVSAHFSITAGREGHLMQLNCQTLDYEFLQFDPDPYELLLVTTGKAFEANAVILGLRKEECFQALMKLNDRKEVKYLSDAAFSDVEEGIDDEILKSRARHVVWENQYVYEAIEAIEENEIEDLGESFDASHLSMAGDFDVSSEELDLLVDAVRIFDGCIGARMTGHSESGSVITLVLKENIHEFEQLLKERYHAITGLDVTVYRCSPSSGIQHLS